MLDVYNLAGALTLDNKDFIRVLKSSEKVFAQAQESMSSHSVRATKRMRTALDRFAQAQRRVSKRIADSMRRMGAAVELFAKQNEKASRRVKAGWWKRFGIVALGFTVAYRAMNAFEAGLSKLVSTITEAIQESGSLASLQAKLAFWYTMRTKGVISFAEAYKRASVNVDAMYKASLHTLSSVEELSTAMDELAQAGVFVPKTMTKAFASFVDFTVMVSKTTGATFKQIRQEIQSLMQGQMKTTNIVIRSLKFLGLLSEEDIKRLKEQTHRTEILGKVVTAVHENWQEVVSLILRSDVNEALNFWNKTVRSVWINTIRLASASEKVGNIFAAAFADAADKFAKTMGKEDVVKRNVVLMKLMRDALKSVLQLFQDAALAIGYLATAYRNLTPQLRTALKAFIGFMAIRAVLVLVRRFKKALLQIASLDIVIGTFKFFKENFKDLGTAVDTLNKLLNSMIAKLLILPATFAVSYVGMRAFIDTTKDAEKTRQEFVDAAKKSSIDHLDAIENEAAGYLGLWKTIKRFFSARNKLSKDFTDEELRQRKRLQGGLVEGTVVSPYRDKGFIDRYKANFKKNFKDLLDFAKPYLESFGTSISDLMEKILTPPDFEKGQVFSLEGLREQIDEAIANAEKAKKVIADFGEAYRKTILSQYQYERYNLKKRFDLFNKYVTDKQKLFKWFHAETERLNEEEFDRFAKTFNHIGREVGKAINYWKNRIQSFRNDFRDVLDNITDALQQFVTTGKMSFKDLVNSILADLARIVIRRSITEPLMTAFSSIAKSALIRFDQTNIPQKRVAKGGIVDRPTFFGFQHGIGLMGEAGPEAILPLKRMPGGNLGVEASNGVNVEIHNYSGTPARVEEGRNARGGRDIKVIIGELAGMNIAEGGALAQIIQRRYGLQPAVIGRS